MESEAGTVELDDFDAMNTYPVNTVEADPNLKEIKNISQFKRDLTPYWTFKDEQLYTHFDSQPKHGGLQMRDPEGVVPQAIKDVAKKVAGKIVTGKLADMSHISQPSYVHIYLSQHCLHKNDMSFAGELKKAALNKDPV